MIIWDTLKSDFSTDRQTNWTDSITSTTDAGGKKQRSVSPVFLPLTLTTPGMFFFSLRKNPFSFSIVFPIFHKTTLRRKHVYCLLPFIWMFGAFEKTCFLAASSNVVNGKCVAGKIYHQFFSTPPHMQSGLLCIALDLAVRGWTKIQTRH